MVVQPIANTSVVVAAKGQIHTDLGGEAVILALESGQYYSLNNVGTRVWELVQESKTVKDLVQEIMEEYDVEAELCKTDILTLLEDLASEGLVEVR